MNKRIIVLILAVLLLLGDIFYEVKFVALNSVAFESEKLSAGEKLKIVQISDYHNANSNDQVLDYVEKIKPDVVVITGDLADMTTNEYTRIFALAEGLTDICDMVYFVSGNHEWANAMGARRLAAELESRGVKVLNNRNESIIIGDIKINICGVDDYDTRHSDSAKAFEGIDETRYTILLSHSPNIIKEGEKLKSDLILSGHTHGGQVRLPFIGAIIAPNQGFFPKYQKGIYELEGGKQLYIDSGVGVSRLPVRFMNRSQITLVEITGKG
ncbi:putative metallophosphoesterase (plasmid) [Peptoclostridium acidaminophilum DSM 3953]|uniref:Putative metallophosphoesterase n=1 Tax=Peptoclostridium acidaminophilum DSM 3953 TaxID=1286171 RepID=W8TKB4_PEPAC|nr:metallophosphoesterase [Peptoclostridium acidaminophilum]AHM58163.1 putative metallophosphoesterase [Peptoclostridium acidaminophilum DSM 3953]